MSGDIKPVGDGVRDITYTVIKFDLTASLSRVVEGADPYKDMSRKCYKRRAQTQAFPGARVPEASATPSTNLTVGPPTPRGRCESFGVPSGEGAWKADRGGLLRSLSEDNVQACRDPDPLGRCYAVRLRLRLRSG